MPRMARVVVPGHPHHVTQRGNRRQAVFPADGDWSSCLSLIRGACVMGETSVRACCLMPNHVHFVLVPSHHDGLRSVLADAHRRYTRRVNFREGWRGHVWQDRFHSCVMDELHLRVAIPYVENNPLRAGLGATPSQWPWSSASEACSSTAIGLVDWRLRGRLLGTREARDVVNATTSLEPFRLHSRTGRPLGADGFVERIAARVGRVPRPKKRGPKPTEKARVAARETVHEVSDPALPGAGVSVTVPEIAQERQQY